MIEVPNPFMTELKVQQDPLVSPERNQLICSNTINSDGVDPLQ